jgi:IS5 family transposase
MLTTKSNSPQLSFFCSIVDLVDPKHELFKLANIINWSLFDEKFAPLYCINNGRPSKPIRLMSGLLILKYLRNISDENLVIQWSENLYYQYFCGRREFTPKVPCSPTEIIAFRQRIGELGVELLLQESIRINLIVGQEQLGSTISLDSTVQPKNITYPTDDKLYKKVIKKCWKIATKEGLVLRQTYTRTVKKLSAQQRFKTRKNGFKIARKANNKIRTIAGRLVREIARKLPLLKLGIYLNDLKLYDRVIKQKRHDKDKIYSLHEPQVKCYTKGKDHKKFEFGSKASIAVDQKTGIIVGAINFTESIHDSKTLPDALDQIERLIGKEPKEVYVDRGYRGVLKNKASSIFAPKPKKKITQTQKAKHRKRAAIEPFIGHLKSDYRLGRNYLYGIIGDNMNVILSAAAMNFKRVINLWRTGAINSFVDSLIRFLMLCGILLPKKERGFLRLD